jgi:hypothetical protein
MARKVDIQVNATNKAGKVFRDIGTDADRMGKAVESGANRSGTALEGMGKKATVAGAALTAITAAAGKAGQAHINEERQLRALERAYGDQSLVIEDFAQKLQDMGIASDDSTRIAALGAQSLAKNYGLTADEILVLVERSADLAQVTFDQYGNQLGLADIMQRVQAAIRGEAESAEVLGVALNDQRLAALAAAEGLTGWTTTMTDAERAAFRMKVFLDDTATAQGAAAERSEELGTKINALKLQVTDAAAAFGGIIGPIGTTAAALDDLALPLLAGSTAFSALGLSLPTIALGGLAAAVAPVAVTMAALAAPIGIATYLFLDQKNVVAEATEITLKNKEVLEDFVIYLESIGTPATFIPEMSQNLKELLDWITKVGDTVDTGLLNIGESEKFFATNLENLSEELRNLSPENLQAVVDTAEQMGIVFGDPETWTPDAVNAVAYAIVNLNNVQGQLIGESNALTMALAQQEIAFTAHIDVVNAAAQATFGMTTEQKASVPVMGDIVTYAGRAAGGLGDLAAGADNTTTASYQLGQAISDLGDHLATDIPAQAGRSYNSIVGYTDGLVSSIAQTKAWSDETTGLLGSLYREDGTLSDLGRLLENHTLDAEDHTEALKAQEQIYGDLTRAQDASAVIQIRNADALAAGSDATADYLENLSKLPETELAVALAWADSDISGRANEIANLGANFDDMSEAQKAAFESMVESAAAADPQLAALLESLGLIKRDVNDPTGWQISMDSSDAEDDMDRLIEAVNSIAEALEIQYMLSVGVDFDDAMLWQAIDNLPDSHLITVYYQDGGYYGRAGYAHGGAVRFASGGVARLAEIGPEMLRFPSGNIGMAMTDGLYALPNGTQVDTAMATRDKLGGMSQPTFDFKGATFYIVPPTPDIHDAIAQQFLAGGLG